MQCASYNVGVDGPQAVTVRNAVGGDTTAQRMRTQRGGARSDEGGS